MSTIQVPARMARLVLIATTIALICSAAGQAQATLTGKWQGETTNGTPITLDLAVDGTALTGTFTRDGVSTSLSEGKVSKNTFTFKAKINDQIEGFSGELSGDQLKVWLDRQGVSRAAVLQRIKG
jgi:hypothetical protein